MWHGEVREHNDRSRLIGFNEHQIESQEYGEEEIDFGYEDDKGMDEYENDEVEED